MAKRIKLLIGLSGSGDQVEYNVYRSKGIITDKSKLFPIASIREELCKKITLNKMDTDAEILTQNEEVPQVFEVSNFFDMTNEPIIYIDNVIVDNDLVEFYPEQRKIELSEILKIGPETNKVIKMEYFYKVLEFCDDVITQNGVSYIGDIETVPTGIEITSKSALFEYNENKLFLTATINNIGKEYSYLIDAYNKELKETKEANLIKHITIKPNSGDLLFKFEYSIDNKNTWIFIQETNTNSISVTDIEKITSQGFPEVNLELIKVNGTDVQLIIENPWHNWSSKERDTFWYRVSCSDVEGAGEKKKEEFKGKVYYKPAAIKIRRKEDNGVPATLDGNDAIDVYNSTLEEEEVSELIINENGLTEEKVYSYTVFMQDEKGLMNIPFYKTIEL